MLFFMKHEYHRKLEFPINGRSLHILKTVADCKIFLKTVVFGHFGLRIFLFKIGMVHS